ncbi:E3 ubiquitin-protein ligase Ubr3-like isoform X2 [Planococcus citri]|uniref:E3 ubiquitin-protein ligase Ubr3-like isoform X2 n=1 Tax=Planococcus citri TaxID=170843 RepID=UPI0031FA35A4
MNAMEPPNLVQQIMDRGKKGAADYLKNCRSPELIYEVLDQFLNPDVLINNEESIDWIKWLMAGGKTPDEFTNLVKKYNKATTCGLVWTANFIAYRCRTCGISPCMSLCAECFQRGHHENHDFNMFRSQAGGACDCGDTSVMRSSGFCDKHGANDESECMQPPPDLMYIAEHITPRIFFKLILYLRNIGREAHPNNNDAHNSFDADNFLTMLSELSSMGSAMRRVLTKALINPQEYKKLTQGWAKDDSKFAAYMATSQKLYEEALASLGNPDPPAQFEDCPGLQKELKHNTFLEELVFWTVKYEFPQKVVCFLLNMLPDIKYKEALTEAFVVHYSRIAMILEKTTDSDMLSNRIVHVSVQLFSNENLAVRMTKEFCLLQVMVVSLKNMMSKILISRTLNARNISFSNRDPPMVVDCSLSVMKDHCYWPLVSDLNNVLSHRPVAVQFMSNDTLTNMWFSFLSYFQGMNVNLREQSQHIEFEPNTYYAAFSAELEASAYPMWALLSHLNNTNTVILTKKMLNNCLTALEEWTEIGNVADAFGENLVSFHIPLHRYLATFICQAVNVQQIPLSEVLPRNSLIASIIRHPLRVQVAFYEIVNGLWVRNGLQIKGQAMTYIQCNFCSSMVDADLYLLQILSTQLRAVDFMLDVVEKFHIRDWLSFFNGVDGSNSSTDSDNDTPMLESFLQFIATLCSNRTNLGVSYYEFGGSKYPILTRLEMVTLLCVADKPHSQLMELMPERCGTGQLRDFDAILEQVADYKAPIFEASGNMQQGLYIPKACVWEKLYDPIHVLLRAVQRKDFQNSMDRFTEFVKQNNLLPVGTVPWPPYRIPAKCNPAYEDPRRILETRVFHSVVWIILYKAVHMRNVSEHVMSLAVYLLEMALSISPPASSNFSQVCSQNTTNWLDVTNLDLATWFLSDWLSANLRTTIRYVVLPPSDIHSDIQHCFDHSAELEWNPYPEAYELSSASQSPLRRLLEETMSSDSEIDQSTASTSLVSSNVNESAIALPSSSHPYGMSYDLELARSAVAVASAYSVPQVRGIQESQPSSSSASSLASDLIPDIQRYLLPVLNRNSGALLQSRKSAVAISTTSSSSNSDSKIFNANESIISLLLKLHSHLSGHTDSFNPEKANSDNLDCRIGDGPAFIGKVLKRIMLLDDHCREEVLQCRQRLWPQRPFKDDGDKKDLEDKEKERKRIARERQKKLIETFAHQRDEFQKKNIDATGEDKMDWEGSDEPQEVVQKEYHCVICGQSSPSKEDKPMGLVVLVQATSILGHKKKINERPVLPVCDKDRANSSLRETLASDFEKKVEELNREFDTCSWWQSVNLGWEGGIHVQTCGHHLHLECLTSYLQSLRNQQRVVVDRGEYLCPLCRQLANSVLPMPPDVGENAAVSSRTDHIPTIISDIGNLMIDIEHSSHLQCSSNSSSALTEAIKKSMGDMTNCTYPKFVQRCDPQQVSTFFLFVTSIARTNLEIDIVQRGGSLLKPEEHSSTRESSSSLIPKRSCLMPLLHVLATHARLLAHPPVWETWQQLTGVVFKEHTSLTLNSDHRSVPLLLRDPAALLTQFVLLLPLNMDQMYFTGIVKLLYNLLYFQVMAQLSCHLKESERNYFRATELDMAAGILMKEFSLDHAMKLTIESMDAVHLYLEDGNLTNIEEPARKTLELQIQELCLPFLRVASVLRHHMYNEPLPGVLVEADEFVRLVYYLELVSCGMDRSKFNSAVVFTWPSENLNFVNFWFDQFSHYVSQNQVWARNFLSELHISWKQPRLLKLPRKYEVIFQYYHQKPCSYCQQVPQKGTVCLVCGTLVCFKQSCCRRERINETIQHSIDCGAGTAMFLVITSSSVIVVRGKRACIWGSVYLDVFGEEDNELKRGKPLFLSEERYNLLEQQWLSHRFDHTSKKWIMHRDAWLLDDLLQTRSSFAE